MSKRYKLKRRARHTAQSSDDNPPCWCGVKNPYYEPVHGTCGGMGIIYCICGGDFCVCHWHGEVECLGCADCEGDDSYGEDYCE